MKRKRFSVEHAVAVLKQAELGTPVANYDSQGWHHVIERFSVEESV